MIYRHMGTIFSPLAKTLSSSGFGLIFRCRHTLEKDINKSKARARGWQQSTMTNEGYKPPRIQVHLYSCTQSWLFLCFFTKKTAVVLPSLSQTRCFLCSKKILPQISTKSVWEKRHSKKNPCLRPEIFDEKEADY